MGRGSVEYSFSHFCHLSCSPFFYYILGFRLAAPGYLASSFFRLFAPPTSFLLVPTPFIPSLTDPHTISCFPSPYSQLSLSMPFCLHLEASSGISARFTRSDTFAVRNPPLPRLPPLRLPFHLPLFYPQRPHTTTPPEIPQERKTPTRLPSQRPQRTMHNRECRICGCRD